MICNMWQRQRNMSTELQKKKLRDLFFSTKNKTKNNKTKQHPEPIGKSDEKQNGWREDFRK